MKKSKILAFIAAALLCASFGAQVSAEESAPATAAPDAVTAAPAADADQAAAPITFPDIPADAPYKAAVEKLVANGVLSGYPDGTFRPTANITRAEMCKMINLTFGYTDTEGAVGFADLNTAEWYMPFVLAAQKAGYIKGDAESGAFRPDDNISREEVCVILYRIIKPYDLPLPVQINDEVSDWAKPYVEAMVKNSLMPLEEGGMFRATQPIKRFELAAAVAPHSVTVAKQSCTVTFTDGDKTQVVPVEIGKALESLPTPEAAPEGMVFAGWSLATDERALIEKEYVFLEDTELFAVYDKKTYTVRFMVDNTIIASTQTVKHGEHPELPNPPSRSGYTFKGWALGSETAVQDIAKYETIAPVTFNAVFEKQDIGGGNGGGGNGGGNGGGKPSKPDDGKDDPKPDDGKEDPPVIVTYNVKFIADGNTVSTQKIERGKFAEKPADPEHEGRTFEHWSLEEDGAAVDVAATEINEDTTFYAVFKLDEVVNPNDPEVIAALEDAVVQFKNIGLRTKIERSVRTIVINTINAALADADAGELIDADYIKTTYKSEIDEAKRIVMKDMSENERSGFVSRVRNGVDDNTFNILTDYFMDEEEKDKYL